MKNDLDEKIQVIKELANKYDLEYISFTNEFNQLLMLISHLKRKIRKKSHCI